MKTPRLSFRSIEIRRMPGFPRGGLEVVDLAPGVNVIYGPNASGKTTLARAIQRLLRPGDAGPQASLAASIELDGASLSIDYDLGKTRCQDRSAGAEVDYPKLAPAEIGDRHFLALHHLIHSESDGDLAREIVRELAGGYDVAEARDSLGWRPRAAGRGKTAKDLESARRAVREATAGQQELLRQQSSLAQLEVAKDLAVEAQARVPLLEKAIELATARGRVEECRGRIEQFPDGVAKTTSHDVERLDKLEEEITSAKGRRRAEEQKAADARLLQQKSELPDGGVGVELVASIREKCRRLARLDEDVRRQKDLLGQAEAECDEARKRLGPAVTPDGAESLDAAAVEELFAFARRAEKHRAEAEARDAMADWLSAESAGDTDGDSHVAVQGDPESADDPGSLRDGIRLLYRWLAVSEGSADRGVRGRSAFFVAAAVIATISLVMALAVHWSWYLLLPAAVALLLWPLGPRRQTDRALQVRREFESHRVGVPDAWDAESVLAHLRRLQRRHDRSALAEEKSARWGQLNGKIAELVSVRQLLETERQEWIERLGIDADVYAAELSLLADHLHRYHQAHARAVAAEAALAAADDGFRSLLEEVGRLLSPFGFEAAGDAETAGAQVEELDRRRQQYDTAEREAARASAALEALDEQIDALAGEQASLFDRVGLTRHQEPTLREWARMRGGYDDAKDQLAAAEAVLQSAESALADHPDLLDLTAEDLGREKQQAVEQAGKLTEISRQIGTIDGSIEAARDSCDLEAKLSAERAAADALLEQREDDYQSVVGCVLADHLVSQQHETETPAVLRRAQRLFAKITHGRYELHVRTADPPEFRAFETAERRGLALDELSDGTRLQLLLAVRVAFVERQEQGVKVPLILDETLANSDERRARQIIEAILEVCREGRQIFYFTAQHDEVGKWRSLLGTAGDVPSQEVDLAEVRRFSQTERVGPIECTVPKPVRVPAPDGVDWLQYGRLLEVEPIDTAGTSGEFHLWYLIDDLAKLHRLLRGGVNRWGQLQTLVAYGEVDDINTESAVYRRADAAARLIEAAVKAWRVGRGKQVDRKTLLDSEAVSQTLIDRVADLTAELDGDAKLLIAALEEGRVRGFRANKRIQLSDYLSESGHLDPRDLLTAEQIREQVRPVVFADVDKGLLTPERFEQLVGMVVGSGSG